MTSSFPSPLLDRRALLQAALAGLSISVLGVEQAWADVAAAAPGAGLPAKTMAFLNAYSDTLIPDTDTPGALKAGAPAFAALLLSRSEPKDLTETLAKLDLIEQDLALRGKAPFTQLKPAARAAVLAAFDQEVMTRPAAPKPAPAQDYGTAYRQLRGLTLLGYYTSEIGGSQELRYELVPGRYDADIPYDPKARAYSNG